MKANRAKISYWLSTLMPTLQDDIEINVVKEVLKMAKEDGLNPSRLYELALETRPFDHAPAPKPEDVMP